MPAADLIARFDEVSALGPHGFTRVAYVEWGPADASQVVGAALQRSGAYMRLTHGFASIEEMEAPLRKIQEPFGPRTDPRWRHLAEHSGVKTEEGDYRQHYDPAIGRAFSWPLMVDIALWNVWDKVACPVMVLRGEDSDLLHASTVREMQKRGIAGKNGLVRAVEVREVGHAPPLMSDAQISLIEEVLADEKVTSKAQRVAGLRLV